MENKEESQELAEGKCRDQVCNGTSFENHRPRRPLA